LSFKIIFIQKSKISVFGKYLNLFEFENLFDLNFNFGFKFKTVEKKFQKHFLHILLSPFSISTQVPLHPVRFPLFLLFLFSCQPISPSSASGPVGPPGHPAQLGPLPLLLPPAEGQATTAFSACCRCRHRATLLHVSSPTELRRLPVDPSLFSPTCGKDSPAGVAARPNSGDPFGCHHQW
jgi:hypothetical protein